MFAIAAEPLLLEPLSPAVLSGTKPVTIPAPDAKMVYKYCPGATDATFTPVSQLNPNMVPQNAAAEGKPVS